MGIIIVDPVTLTLEFNPFFENFNLANNFLTMNARAFIFHMYESPEGTWEFFFKKPYVNRYIELCNPFSRISNRSHR